MQEVYFLNKNMNTTYTDVMDMTPVERQYLISFLIEDFNRIKEAREAQEASRKDSQRG